MESFWPRASTSARDPAEASEGARRQSWQELQAGEARFFLPFISRFLHGQEARQGPGKRRTGLSPRVRTYGKGAGASERLKQASKPGRARARVRAVAVDRARLRALARPSSATSTFHLALRPPLFCSHVVVSRLSSPFDKRRRGWTFAARLWPVLCALAPGPVRDGPRRAGDRWLAQRRFFPCDEST
jgi:hypothetical protein